MIDRDFIAILSCPKRTCRGDLKSTETNGKEVLTCTACQKAYPVEEDIPILFPNAKYSPDIHQRHWDQPAHASSYAKKYDAYLKKQGSSWGLYTHVSELEAIRRLTAGIDLTGKTIIDAGCGQARILEEYKEAKVKIGLDTSLALLIAAKKRNPSLWLVCGQLEDMPFKDAVADFSVSIRVFQHLLTPETAFSEMVRTTKPDGFVSLEVYNKLNLKEIYKRFRMIPWLNKIKPWGLSYDKYFSFREINGWAEENFVKPVAYTGSGWGFYFYILELLKFRLWAPEILQKIIYDFFLVIERKVANLPLIRVTMEKISFIGSIKAKPKKKSSLKRLLAKLKRNRKRTEFKNFQKIFKVRNYSLVGDDKYHLRLSVDWLKKAQDATADAGISRGVNLLGDNKSNCQGWQPSYPETSGYVIPTLIKSATLLHDSELLRRAGLIADWEINIMSPTGGVYGGNIGKIAEPVAFDTGQVIRGLMAIHTETKEEKYRREAERAAAWLKTNWTEANAFDSYALAPVAALSQETGQDDYLKMAERAGQFCLNRQNDQGWFADCDFDSQRNDPLLHTIGYAIDGLWDIGEILGRAEFKTAAKKALDGALSQMDEKGFIPGRLNESWLGTVDWACLTGIAQIGVTAMKVYKAEGKEFYRDKAELAKEFLKTNQNLTDKKYGGLGAIWGSWPMTGDYNAGEALNWPVKYFADLLILFIEEENDKN